MKSTRLGWPAGFQAAQEALGRSLNVRDVLWASVFEDLWPARADLPEVMAEVDALDLEALCRRDTHHGARRLSAQYAELASRIESTLWTRPGYAVNVGEAKQPRSCVLVGR